MTIETRYNNAFNKINSFVLNNTDTFNGCPIEQGIDISNNEKEYKFIKFGLINAFGYKLVLKISVFNGSFMVLHSSDYNDDGLKPRLGSEFNSAIKLIAHLNSYYVEGEKRNKMLANDLVWNR